MNRYSILTSPRNFAGSFREIHWERDPVFIAAKAEADSFAPEMPVMVERRELLLEQATAKYLEKLQGYEALDRKREWLITFSMGAVTFLAAARQFAPKEASTYLFSVPFAVSMVCFLIAVLVLLCSRRVVRFPGRFTIQQLREGLADERIVPEDWIAAALHKSSEALRVLSDITAAHMNFALCWIVVALVALLPIVLFTHK